MSDARTGQVSGSAAEVYERFFVPALFGQWPERVLDLVGAQSGDRVLDLGCGTGVVARASSARVGRDGKVTGVDPNPGMLSVAERMCPGVELRLGVAEDLPFEVGAFDRVVCQFALMFFTDRARAIQEVRRVLRPSGSLAVVTWAEVRRSPGYAAMADLLRRLLGDKPADALLAPFSIGTEDALAAELRETFPDVAVVALAGEAVFPSVRDWVHTDIKGWTLGDMVDAEDYQRLQAEAARELGRFVADDGRVRFAAPALAAVANAAARPR